MTYAELSNGKGRGAVGTEAENEMEIGIMTGKEIGTGKTETRIRNETEAKIVREVVTEIDIAIRTKNQNDVVEAGKNEAGVVIVKKRKGVEAETVAAAKAEKESEAGAVIGSVVALLEDTNVVSARVLSENHLLR